jgi:hypothetical protein
MVEVVNQEPKQDKVASANGFIQVSTDNIGDRTSLRVVQIADPVNPKKKLFALEASNKDGKDPILVRDKGGAILEYKVGSTAIVLKDGVSLSEVSAPDPKQVFSGVNLNPPPILFRIDDQRKNPAPKLVVKGIGTFSAESNGAVQTGHDVNYKLVVSGPNTNTILVQNGGVKYEYADDSSYGLKPHYDAKKEGNVYPTKNSPIMIVQGSKVGVAPQAAPEKPETIKVKEPEKVDVKPADSKSQEKKDPPKGGTLAEKLNASKGLIDKEDAKLGAVDPATQRGLKQLSENIETNFVNADQKKKAGELKALVNDLNTLADNPKAKDEDIKAKIKAIDEKFNELSTKDATHQKRLDNFKKRLDTLKTDLGIAEPKKEKGAAEQPDTYRALLENAGLDIARMFEVAATNGPSGALAGAPAKPRDPVTPGAPKQNGV